DELVLAIEPAARTELLPRGVDRDVAPALPIEERDVLGGLRRSRVGEAAEPPGADFGDEIARRGNQRPSLPAQIAQVDVEGLTDVIVEDLRGAAEIAGGHRPRRQRPVMKKIPELRGTNAKERRIEVGGQLRLA